MKLRDLEATFIKRIDDRCFRYVEDYASADGVQFLCPRCFENSGGSGIGVHSVICWFRGRVPDSMVPGPGRWNPQGTSLDDLTFVGPEPCSVDLRNSGGCCWHGHVRNGEATLA